MNKPKLVDQVFAFVAAEENGDEGLTAFLGPDDMWVPMIACDQARLKSLMEAAEEIATATGREIKIYHFTQRKHIGTVTKDGLTTL